MTETRGGGPARYVALEHRRTGDTHCDLMLEHEGKLITWRLKGLDALVAKGELRGERLPDHRLAYLDYEGPVSGGRGSVRRLAHGSITEMNCSARRICVTLDGDLAGRLVAEHVQDNWWRINLLKESRS